MIHEIYSKNFHTCFFFIQSKKLFTAEIAKIAERSFSGKRKKKSALRLSVHGG
jgi:hypothetical protein